MCANYLFHELWNFNLFYSKLILLVLSMFEFFPRFLSLVLGRDDTLLTENSGAIQSVKHKLKRFSLIAMLNHLM